MEYDEVAVGSGSGRDAQTEWIKNGDENPTWFNNMKKYWFYMDKDGHYHKEQAFINFG